MSNPNDNQNAYHQALKINRTLKKEIDELKKLLKARETIRIPISEHDFDHEVKDLVFNDEEFQWGAFYTVESERPIDVEFIPEVDDYERGKE